MLPDWYPDPLAVTITHVFTEAYKEHGRRLSACCLPAHELEQTLLPTRADTETSHWLQCF